MGFDESFSEIFFGNWPQKCPRTYQKQVFSMVLPPVSGVFYHFRFIASCTLTSLAGASLRKAAAAKPYGARCSSGSLESHPISWIWIQSMASFQVVFNGCHYGIKMEYSMASSIIIFYVFMILLSHRLDCHQWRIPWWTLDPEAMHGARMDETWFNHHTWAIQQRKWRNQSNDAEEWWTFATIVRL